MTNEAINAGLVKDLRAKTGAGMMDCKKALVEAKGNIEEASDWLRKKGLSAAAKKSDRLAAEGLTAVKVDGKSGAIIEINSETDFVARNEKFQNLVKIVADLALKSKDVEELKSAKIPTGISVADEIIENIATIGENISLRRMNIVTVQSGVVASYVHNAVVEGLGKISVLIGLESNSDNKARLNEVGKQIAMHIAANNPFSLDVSSLDPAVIEREKNIFAEQSRASGKPDNIIEKMVDGRIRKFLAEVVLLEQPFLFDDKQRVTEILENLAKELGTTVKITEFIRYELGEGIEKEEKNFADEVAAVSKA